jgi:hypothetical protein
LTHSELTRRLLCVAFVACAITAWPDLGAAEEDHRTRTRARAQVTSDSVEVVYRGLLQDERGQPVSAVLPLTFRLYRTSMSAEPVWTEEHFVSIIDGRYQVSLGRQTPLQEQLLVGERWLGVELTGEGEILRDQITITRPGQTRSPNSGNGDGVATVAERALVADNALALDGITAEDIEELANLALLRLGEHMADPNAHSASARYRIGSERVVPTGAGGAGGTPFDVRCPPGHVVTGIEGRAGRLLDYMTVVCSPLE